MKNHSNARSAVFVTGLVFLGFVATSPAMAIVGGNVVRSTDDARSWTVKIDSSRGELCTGVPIDRRVILTAAHCVIRGGRFTVSALDEGMRRRQIRVVGLMAHESFLPGLTPSTQPGVDLAVLLLAEPLPGSIVPAGLGGSMGFGDSLTISGFGLGQEGRSGSARTLRQTSLTSAGSYTSGNSVIVAVDALKLGQAPGAGACKGDSGGPIMRGASGELVGIVSWSSGPANQRVRSVCGGFTAITPVADHRAWITNATSALLASTPAAAADERLGTESLGTERTGPRQRGRNRQPASAPAVAAESVSRTGGNN